VSLAASLIVLYLVSGLYAQFRDGAVISVQWLELLPELTLHFEIDALGMLFALVASFLWLVTTVYAIGYMRGHNESHQTRFYACFAVAMGAVMAIAFSANLFTLFIFYEVLT